MITWIGEFLTGLTNNWIYLILLAFLGIYPLVSALVWIAGAIVFLTHRETSAPSFYQLDEHPKVSILIAARNEETVLPATLDSLIALDWPDYEIVVVDDGSTDRTPAILAEYAERGDIRMIRKNRNEGKAMALNDALPLLAGEIVLLIDADGRPQPDALRYLVPHFVKVPSIAAVTANPRVANTRTFLSKLQAMEFSTTVSVLRRAQSTWGNIMTISGVCTAVRRSALEEVGRFQPAMATEDIALTWQLQRAGWEVRYEPRAVFAMQVPEDRKTWWNQRTRWARGMGQVLRQNVGIFAHISQRRLWPIYIEALLSTLWAHLFFVFTLLWCIAIGLFALTGIGANPIPQFWGLIVGTACMVQVILGLWLDGRYDRKIRRYVVFAPFYPLIYWAFLSLAAVRGTIPGAVRKNTTPVTWTQSRYAVDRSSS